MRLDTRDLEKFIYHMGVNVCMLTDDDKRALLKPFAKAIKKRMQTYAVSMLKGKYFAEEVKKSIYMDSRGLRKRNPYYMINFRGILHKIQNGKKVGGDERAAAVAFLNEYGVPRTKNQKRARPFIKEAIYDGFNDCELELMAILDMIVAAKLVKGWTHIQI